MKIKILFITIILMLIVGCVEQNTTYKDKVMTPNKEIKKIDIKKTEIRWKQFTSPQNRFTIYIPEGWTFKAYSEDEANIAFSPTGKNVPEVGIIFWFADPAKYRQRITAKEFLENVMIPLFREKNPNIGVESVIAKSDTVAETTISGTYYDQNVKTDMIVYMDYLYDETLPDVNNIYNIGGYWNFGFITAAIASPEELSKIKPLAAQLTGSFKPNNKWLAEIKSSIANGIATRMQIIKGTVARISQMEYEQRMSEMQSNYNIGLGWINALGGTVDARNPDTGEIWHVDYTYKYYYQQGSTIMGTDESTAQPGWTPLEIVR